MTKDYVQKRDQAVALVAELSDLLDDLVPLRARVEAECKAAGRRIPDAGYQVLAKTRKEMQPVVGFLAQRQLGSKW